MGHIHIILRLISNYGIAILNRAFIEAVLEKILVHDHARLVSTLNYEVCACTFHVGLF